MQKFSFLEKDEKTFNYLKMYLQQSNKCCFGLDNRIQLEEIKTHLLVNNYGDNNYEKERWISEHGHNFRIFLNSLKLISIIYITVHKKKDIQWNEFCDIVDNINQCKVNILDTIF